MKKTPKFLLVILGCVLFLSINLITPFLSNAQNNSCLNTISQADLLFTQGKYPEAERLYRQCKPSFSNRESNLFPEAFSDPSQLSPAGGVYWRIANEGWNDPRRLESKIFVPLQKLLESDPAFTPAYGLMIQASQEFERPDEALNTSEQAVAMFPFDAEMAKLRIDLLAKDKQWLEASIAARQFAIINEERIPTEQFNEFTKIADDYFGRFSGDLNSQIIVQGILGTVAGFFTGNFESGVINTLGMAQLMLSGESNMGASLAAQYKSEYSAENRLINDPEILEYVDKIGQDVAKLMGRSDFQYEFNVVEDPEINAFALPGGKVFINSGAIFAAKTEAELAGLIGHEVAHAVLSHGFQRITHSNLLNNLGAIIPFGNFFSTLVTLDYSRSNERQSDILGTRALAAHGYAADGLRNFFVTLNEQNASSQPEYLSTHPATENRISSIEQLITQNGYNRFAFEGIDEHTQMQQKLKQLLSSNR
jgi:Zn-dependent protease with chaperone function